MVKFWTAKKTLDFLVRFRFRMAKLIYDRIFIFLIRDESWQEKLFSAFTPNSGDRILNLGPHSSLSALSLAERYPGATFSAMDTNSRVVAKLQRRIARTKLRNITLTQVTDDNNLSFEARSFDKVICMLALHQHPPDSKLSLIKEIARVLRRDGMLYVIDFDRPANRSEGGMLEFARRISGSAAVAPHLNGRWIECLAVPAVLQPGSQSDRDGFRQAQRTVAPSSGQNR